MVAQDLDDVRERRSGIEQDIEDSTREIQELRADIARRTDEIAALDARAEELRVALEAANEALETRARSAFKRGGLSTLEAIMSSGGPSEAVERVATLGSLARRDDAAIQSATALRVQLEQTEALRRDALAGLQALEAEVEDRLVVLGEELEETKELEVYLELKAKRQVMIDRGVQQGIYSCPMGTPFSFIDSWGFARSGGRAHKGVDIMAPHGTPIYAFTSGRITRMKSGGIGGVVLYLWGDDGNQYYYAHLAGYAEGVYAGMRVEAGDLVAYNGDTGNARGGASHLHFEVHPGGGGAVNPYPWAAAACYG